MQTETIITTLMSAAAFLKTPVQEVATQAIKDLFGTMTYYLKRKLGAHSPAAKALELAIEKPDSEARKAVLVEECATAGLESDVDLDHLVRRLAALLPEGITEARQHVQVSGRGHRVQVAGRDLITAERHVHRNVITPGEAHISAEQRTKLATLIAQVADRFAGEDGKPRFGAVHAMLQRRFSIASYLLLPTEKFAEATSFLMQQRAIYRAGLRRRNPIAYERDFLRAIHARRVELGWIKQELYAFAVEKLGLKKPLTSLTHLGPIQLKTLAALMRRQARNAT